MTDAKDNDKTRTETMQRSNLDKAEVALLRTIAEACKIMGCSGVDSLKKTKAQVVNDLMAHVGRGEGCLGRWETIKVMLVSAAVTIDMVTDKTAPPEKAKDDRKMSIPEAERARAAEAAKVKALQSSVASIQKKMDVQFESLKSLILAGKQAPPPPNLEEREAALAKSLRRQALADAARKKERKIASLKKKKGVKASSSRSALIAGMLHNGAGEFDLDDETMRELNGIKSGAATPGTPTPPPSTNGSEVSDRSLWHSFKLKPATDTLTFFDACEQSMPHRFM